MERFWPVGQTLSVPGERRSMISVNNDDDDDDDDDTTIAVTELVN
jgi:hypothetical protein